MHAAEARNRKIESILILAGLLSKADLAAINLQRNAAPSPPLDDWLLAHQWIDQTQHQALRMLIDAAEASHLDPKQTKLGPATTPLVDDTYRTLLPPSVGNDPSDAFLTVFDGSQGESGIAPAEKTLAEKRSLSTAERFRILRHHASGGLGEVMVAVDGELNREVALKRIRAQWSDDPQARQRFLVEAEVTGKLEHPGVVPVYGLGIDPSGQLFYAMRFIEGDSLRDASQRFHLSRREGAETERALELRKLLSRFVDVCQTIEYAHSRGVVHRDIKPDNILLGPYGETLVVDWGLAKTTADEERFPTGDAADLPLQTASGSASAPTAMGSIIGTPAFMSPEQAAGAVDSIGPHSDIYSLGATLYFILCGKTPLEASESCSGKTTGMVELLQRIVEGEIPVVHEVDPQVERPLSAICAKAMSGAADGRYPSAAALADDLERYLADQPIKAYPDPWYVKAQRWARRHRTAATTSLALTILTVVGLVVFSSLLGAKQIELEETNRDLFAAQQRATTAAETALQRQAEAEQRQREAEVAREEADNAKANELAFGKFLVDKILATARPEGLNGGLGIDVTVVDALAHAEKEIDSVFAGRPQAEAITRMGIGESWRMMGFYKKAVTQHERAVEILRDTYGENSVETAKGLSALALSVKSDGDLQRAMMLQQAAYQTLLPLAGKRAPETLIAMNNLALTYAENGQLSQGIEMMEEVVEISREVLGAEAPETLNSVDNLGSMLRWSTAEDQQRALRIYEQVVPQKRRVLGETHPETLSAINNLATLYQALGKPAEGIQMLEETVQRMRDTLGEYHPQTLRAETNLAYLFSELGELERAAELLERLEPRAQEKLGKLHPDTLNAADILAGIYDAAGLSEQAIERYRQVLEGRREKIGNDAPDTLTTENNLALALWNQGELTEAAELFEDVLQRRRRLLRPGNRELLNSLNNAAGIADAIGDSQTATRLYEELLATVGTAYGDEERWRVMHNLSEIQLRTNQVERAVELRSQLVREMESGDSDPDRLKMAMQGLAAAHLFAHDYVQAEPLYATAVADQRQEWEAGHDEGSRWLLRGLLANWAECLNAVGKPAEAERAGVESLEILLAMNPGGWREQNIRGVIAESQLLQGKTDGVEEPLRQSLDGLKEAGSELPVGFAVHYVGKAFDRLAGYYQISGDEQRSQAVKAEKEEYLRNLRKD